MNREYKIALSQEYYSDIVYLSQYDSDYDLVFSVLDKYSKATQINGYTAKFQGTRTDGLGFLFEGTASDDRVAFHINTSLTAISGTHKGEIVFYDDNGLFYGSANVQIVVEPAARPDGTIDADVERAEEIAEQIQQIVDTAAEQTTAEAERIVSDLEADVSELNSGLSYLFEDEQLINARHIAANNNSALVNNDDGTYTIGTTDFGNTTFGGLTTLTPGDYYLFGVPNGIAYLSTVGTSQSYANRVFENTSNVPKKIHIDTEQSLWVGFRSPSKPTSSYTISPSLYFHKPKVYDALRFMGVLENGTDLNNLLDSGIYLLSSDRGYTNAPLTNGYLLVFATGNAIQQICIQYGGALMSVGAIYKRDGSKSGVTADWHRLGRLLNHNIAFFGDSIMWGRDGSASASTRTSWQIPVIVGNSLQVSAINYGVSGQGYLPTNESPACAYDNISAKNLDNFDTIVLCYGVNDGYHPLGSWNSDDETTIMGQFNKIINYIFAQKPTMRVIVFAPFNGTNVGSYPDYWYGARNHQDGYVSRKVLSDTLKQACDYYWIPYIEQYDSPINAKNITTQLPDGVHPNETAYKQIGEWFAAKIGGLLS